MQAILDMLKRGMYRVNLRIALLLLSLPISGVAIWQGVTRWKSTPTGPVRQVATGVQPSKPPATFQPAVASFTDEPTPTVPAEASHRLVAFDQSSATPSPAASTVANPYLPTSSDPAGGYRAATSNASQYGVSDSAYGSLETPATAPPAVAIPSDPTAIQPAAEEIPENTFRSNAGSAAASALPAPPAYPPLNQSPYGDNSSPPASSPAPPETLAPQHSPPSLAPTSAAASSFAAPYGQMETQSASQPGIQLAPQSPAIVAPANVLPPMQSSRGLSPRDPERLAAATPGERQFEGAQQPSIALEKVAPSEIQVGKPARFDLYVRNMGRVPALGVTITDHVPAGTQLLDARPAPQQTGSGELVWELGVMQPGEETQITLQVMPQTEGEIGSTAQVSFAAAATSRSICTRPQLAIEHTAAPKVLIGDAMTVSITISNPGTGPATGVIIEEDVPAGLVHAAGSQLEYDIGTLRPGETKHLDLALRAEKPGLVQNTIRVRGEGGLAAQHAVQIEVVAPQLQVAVEGPKLRFLERQATYTVQVANPGTAAARDVELIAHLPRGMKFVATDSMGQYDVSQHAVHWSLAELPQATKGAVKLTLLPVEAGDQPLRVEGRGALGLAAVGEQVVRVEQAAELVHTVKDLDEVIEVGSETTYEIRVLNKGTKAASNVRVAALMSPGMAAIHGEGPTRAAGDATQIAFEPLARLNPQEEVIYKVQAQGRQPGDQIVRVQISSDEWPAPVTREESTRVYQDR